MAMNNEFPELEAYRVLKRRLVQDQHLLSYLYPNSIPQMPTLMKKYYEYKQQHLESKAFLDFDYVIGNFPQFSIRVKERHQIVLITMRNDRARLTQQLTKLNLLHLFDRVVRVSAQKGNPKFEALKNVVGSGDYMIGDSEVDMQCGKLLGIKTFHVDTGLRSYEYAAKNCDAIRLTCYSDLIQYL